MKTIFVVRAKSVSQSVSQWGGSDRQSGKWLNLHFYLDQNQVTTLLEGKSSSASPSSSTCVDEISTGRSLITTRQRSFCSFISLSRWLWVTDVLVKFLCAWPRVHCGINLKTRLVYIKACVSLKAESCRSPVFYVHFIRGESGNWNSVERYFYSIPTDLFPPR